MTRLLGRSRKWASGHDPNEILKLSVVDLFPGETST